MAETEEQRSLRHANAALHDKACEIAIDALNAMVEETLSLDPTPERIEAIKTAAFTQIDEIIQMADALKTPTIILD